MPLPTPVPDNANLIDTGKLLEFLDPKQRQIKVPPGDYAVSKTLTMYAGCTYDWTGVRLVATQPMQMLKMTGPNITVRGGILDSVMTRTKPKGQNPKVGVLGLAVEEPGFTWEYPEFRNIDTGLMLYGAQNGHAGQHDTILVEPHATADVRGDMLYMGGGDESLPRGRLVVVGGLLEDSEQEHGVRNSTPGFTNAWFYGTVFRNTNNKEPLALRRAKWCTFINITVDSTMGVYIGNNPVEKDGEESHHLTFKGGQLIGGGLFLIMGNSHDILIDGMKVDIRDDLVAPGNEPVPVSCSQNVRDVMFKNMTRYTINSNKPFYRNFTGKSDKDAGIVDGGGNQTVRVPSFPH